MLNKPNPFSSNIFQQDHQRAVDGQMFQTPLPRDGERRLQTPEFVPSMAPSTGLPRAQVPTVPMPSSPPQPSWPAPGQPPPGCPPVPPPTRAQSHRHEHERTIFLNRSAAAQGQPVGGCDIFRLWTWSMGFLGKRSRIWTKADEAHFAQEHRRAVQIRRCASGLQSMEETHTWQCL